MKKAVKNKKLLVSVVSLFSALVIMLVGTFAWSLIEEAETGGQGYSYDYLVKLMDDSTNPLIIKNNWKVGEVLDKLVYATSSYNNSTIKTKYDEIIADNPEAVFSDTWVRIQLEEVLTRNGSSTSQIVKELNEGIVVSQFSNYFTLLNSADTQIITLAEWDGESQGRFWILDENTGWLYWAQPVTATTFNEDLIDQTTDLIVDAVKLINKPSGTWTYTIKATLDAMDVELDGYVDEGAWSDVLEGDKIYKLFYNRLSVPVEINAENFPDSEFRDFIIIRGYDLDDDGWLSQEELDVVTVLNPVLYQIESLKGIEYFRNLEHLHVGHCNLSSIDLSRNLKVNDVEIHNTPLAYLNISKNFLLEELTIYGGNLNHFDLGKNPKLKILRLTDLNLGNIDISKNEDLTDVSLARTQLTQIDVSKNQQLQYLSLLSNELTDINVSNNQALTTLRLDGNKITTLDVSNNINLEKLHVKNNYLSILDVTSNSVLTELLYNEQRPDGVIIEELIPGVSLFGWPKD